MLKLGYYSHFLHIEQDEIWLACLGNVLEWEVVVFSDDGSQT